MTEYLNSPVASVEVLNDGWMYSGVLEAAIIGIPSEEWGESVHAAVVLRLEHSAIQTEIVEYCRT